MWNDVFIEAQKTPSSASRKERCKATVLIETILAAFEMDEILYELREHSAGLNCGRWDYIFSFIKKFRARPEFVLPDRAQVTMGVRFLQSYSHLLIKTCHRRGAHAMGGMAAQIPIRGDDTANAAAMEKVRADKLREATAGHDGTWVGASGARADGAQGRVRRAYERPGTSFSKLREDVTVTAADLLAVPEGLITEQGLRTNVEVSLLYLESWLRGVGCVPIHHLMEDAATAEISRAQIWQWIRHPGGRVTDGLGGGAFAGRKITRELFKQVLAEEFRKIRGEMGESKFNSGKYAEACELLEKLVVPGSVSSSVSPSAASLDGEFIDFLTLPAYQAIG